MQAIPAIMFQATSSSAGKSVLAAGLCRLLARSGFNVAPFKAQNMSLNSYVDANGGEMGIAQAVQALACGLAPDAAMNPVLLKPLGDRGSQVIVAGKPYGIMTWREYTKLKPLFWKKITAAWREIAAGRDAVILEGAGSPAEINLVRHDIVNMRMASFANAKVLLIADIDRGGAFAALAGTMSLLSGKSRRLVAGFILNKFRGDRSLLAPAIAKIEKRCKRPFLGVIPMLENPRLPEEDSQGIPKIRRRVRDGLDIAAAALPAMSNMADWDALAAEADVNIRLVENGDDLGFPDLLILPGSRNTPKSLAWLKANGLFEAILVYAGRIAARGRGNIVGICAGFEILGESVRDPLNIEAGGEHRGLGLLPFDVELSPAKILARRAAKIRLDTARLPCAGYEIHHGILREKGQGRRIITAADGAVPGLGRKGKGPCRVWGTWLHGIFDADAFRHDFLERLRAEANLPSRPAVRYELGPELDRVADALAANMNLDAIYSLLDQKRG